MKDRGFITFAQNTNAVDYVRLAYLQALSIKTSNKINSYAVLVDHSTMQQVTDRQREVFDYVIEIPGEDCAKYSQWKLQNEWKAQIATPFIETIKLEADMIVPTSIDHWWDILSNKDIVFTNKICDYREQISDTRVYRQVFDHNNLPDVYNAITYWRLSKTAQDFFNLVKNIFTNWESYKILLKFPEQVPSTDVVYAMAAQILGPELVTLPQGFGPQIVHMKSGMNPFTAKRWTDELVWETNPMRIQTVAQWGFVHLNVKDWHHE